MCGTTSRMVEILIPVREEKSINKIRKANSSKKRNRVKNSRSTNTFLGGTSVRTALLWQNRLGQVEFAFFSWQLTALNVRQHITNRADLKALLGGSSERSTLHWQDGCV